MTEMSGIRWRKSSRSNDDGACVEVGRVWRKSSRSQEYGACVEVASDLPWRKSSHSTGQGSECVEVAPAVTVVAVRDSKHPDRDVLTFSRRAWKAFASGL